MKGFPLLAAMLFCSSLYGQSNPSAIYGTWNQEQYTYLPCDVEVYDEFRVTSDDKNLGPATIHLKADSVYLEFKNKPAESYPCSLDEFGENGFVIKMKLRKKFLRKQRYKYLFIEEWTANTLEIIELTSGCTNTKKGTQTPYDEITYSMVKKGSGGDNSHQIVREWCIDQFISDSALTELDTLILTPFNLEEFHPETTCFKIKPGSEQSEGPFTISKELPAEPAGNFEPQSGTTMSGGLYNWWQVTGDELHWYNKQFVNSGLPQDVLLKFKYRIEEDVLTLVRIRN